MKYLSQIVVGVMLACLLALGVYMVATYTLQELTVQSKCYDACTKLGLKTISCGDEKNCWCDNSTNTNIIMADNLTIHVKNT